MGLPMVAGYGMSVLPDPIAEEVVMTDIQALISKNQMRWNSMRSDPSRVPTFQAIAARLCAPDAKAKFQAVTDRLQAGGYQPVPWWVIAVIAEREYGGPPHWDKQLGQGDPLDRVSVNDPDGRGPFLDHPGDNATNNAWLRCALDALVDCAPHAAHWTDWSPGGTMTILEEYNGLGYAIMGVPSAYVWSGTDQYVSGKYIADHVYRAGVKDVQEGCAPIVEQMMALDKTIRFPGALEVMPATKATPPAKQVVLVMPRAPLSDGPKVLPAKGIVSELLDAWHKL
jgi:lysozyme family protein